MLDGRRKSIEPMAARLGEIHYQALHHFVATSPWDWRPVRRRLAERLVAALAPTAWVVDDTGFPKDGTCSVGVQRQYTLGKTANCQLGISVDAVTEQASCPLDWRLFLPERWDEDAMAERRAAYHLPAAVHHRPKWQLVLDMLDELAAWGLRPPVLGADCGYGEVGEFAGGWTPVRSTSGGGPLRHLGLCRAGVPDHCCLHRQGPPTAVALPGGAVLAGPARPPGRAAGLRGSDLAAGQQGPTTRPVPGVAGAPGRGHATPPATSRRR
jgi:hypothetical protein